MAKQLTKYNRLSAWFNKLFDELNADFFGGVLPKCVITISPSSKSYAHYTAFDAWTVQGEGYHEINIASGTLDRPLEEVVASLLHEMVHEYNDLIRNIQDCSSKGQYHNAHFKSAAEAHGLIVTKSDKYGWAHTAPADRLIEWILERDLQEIQMSRINLADLTTTTRKGGNTTGTGRNTPPKSNYRRYVCPKCGLTARTTRDAKIACLDCQVEMIHQERGED